MKPETKKAIDELLLDGLRSLGDSISAGYKQLVRETLGRKVSIMQSYLQAIQAPEPDLQTGVKVGLPPRGSVYDRKGVANLAWRFEAGGPAFNLKDVMKDSPQIKHGKNGWYVNVPLERTRGQVDAFTQGRPGAQNAVARMKPGTVDPSRAHAGREGGAIVQFGTRLIAGWVPKIKQGFDAASGMPLHSSDPLHGMVRLESPYSKKDDDVVKQFTGYRAWRRLSEHSPDFKWQMPKTEGKHIAEAYAGSTQYRADLTQTASIYAPLIAALRDGAA